MDKVILNKYNKNINNKYILIESYNDYINIFMVNNNNEYKYITIKDRYIIEIKKYIFISIYVYNNDYNIKYVDKI